MSINVPPDATIVDMTGYFTDEMDAKLKISEAILGLMDLAGDLFWTVSKGRLTSEEPLYAVAIYGTKDGVHDGENAIAVSESNDLTEAVAGLARLLRAVPPGTGGSHAGR